MPKTTAPPAAPVRRKPVIGVALGSGSARGWAHLGVLRALEAAGVRPGVVCGTSIGALVGGAHVLGARERLEQWVLGLGRRDVVSFMDFSLGGGLLSLLVMSLLLHFFKDKISIILVSVFGAITHNLGQVIVAAIVVQTTSLLLYFLFLMLLAIPTGLFIGITARELMRLLSKTTIFTKLNLPQKK